MHSMRLARVVVGAVVAMGVAGCSELGGGGAWRDLYRGGATLAGWHEVGGGVWSIEDGVIVGRTGDGRYGWLVTDEAYADFVLELECKHEGKGNSGIQFRSHVIDGTMYGWQADFDPPASDRAGAVYDEGGKRQWIAKATAPAAAAFKEGDWNRYRITCAGDHVTVDVNGVKAVDFHDRQFTRGVIALQVHSGKKRPVHVKFRNVRVKVLDEYAGFTPLFDGKTLAGWRVAGDEQWKVEDGDIVASCKQGAQYCYLVSEKTYRDFDAKLRFKWETQTGNSGFFFRCTIDGVDIKGPQAEISSGPGLHTGLIYSHGWRNMGMWDALKDKVYRVGAWNTMEVRAVGPAITVHVNGWPVTENLVDKELPREGIIALQMHSGAAMKIRFKDLWIKVLDGEAVSR